MAQGKPQVIDQPTFDKIECSRCGQCCQNIVLGDSTHGPDDACDPPCGYTGFWLHGGPLGYLEQKAWQDKNDVPGYTDDFVDWLAELEPFQTEDGEWRYSCPHFATEPDGTGTCTIYERRPRICSEFPYGRVIAGYDQCVWDEHNVALLDFDVVEGVEVG